MKSNVKPVETVGGIYHVRELSARQAVRLEAAVKGAGGDTEKLLELQLSAFVCGPLGEDLPGAADLLDAPQSVAMALIKAGSEINGMGADRKGN